MIDIQSELFTNVSNALEKVFGSKLYITSLYVPVPERFPAVSFVEEDNYINNDRSTTDDLENSAVLMCEVNVYSNNKTTRQSECRKIMKVIDDYMISHNFTRTMMNPIPNELDATIYRMTARYEAEVDKNDVIYRR